jgi:methyl-accepting chemotaxis protein
MKKNEDTTPRNLIFLVALLASAVFAYFLNGYLFGVFKLLFGIDVEYNFEQLIRNSDIWGIASYWSTFSLLIFTISFFVPAISNIVKLIKLKNVLAVLPKAEDEEPNITREKFLTSMSDHFVFYSEFAVPFSAYIVEHLDRKVKKQAKFIRKGRPQKEKDLSETILQLPSKIFDIEKLLHSHLSSWFMSRLPKILAGIGLLMFVVAISGMLQIKDEVFLSQEGKNVLLMGSSSLALCIGVLLIIIAFHRLMLGHIFHPAAELIKMLDSLFEYHPEEDGEKAELKAVEVALNKSVSSFKDVSNGLKTSFEDFSKKLEKIQTSIDCKQKQSFDEIAKPIEELVKNLSKEVLSTSSAIEDKNGILKDLNKTAKDLSKISSASDEAVNKFDQIKESLDNLIEQIEKMAPMSAARKEEISTNLNKVKKGNRTVGMGSRAVNREIKKEIDKYDL